MEIQLYTCDRMNARITTAQCERNRKGVPHTHNTPGRAPCLSCAGCPGLSSDPQQIIVPMSVDITPAEAVILPSKKRSVRAQGAGRQQPKPFLMSMELQQQILARTMSLIQIKLLARAR